MLCSGEIFFRSLEKSKFLSVWPSSVDGDLSNCINLPIVIMRSSYFADRDVHGRINLPIAIYAIVLFRNRNLRDCVIFSWSRV